MRAIIAIVALTIASAAVVSATTTTHSPSEFAHLAKPETSVTDSGLIRVKHTLHQKYKDDSGRETFVDLDAEVHIDPKFKFVALHELMSMEDKKDSMDCRHATAKEVILGLTVNDATRADKLLKEITAAHDSTNGVVVGHGANLRCGARQVFGHITSFEKESSTTVKIVLKQGRLHDIFEHADVDFKTNHFQHVTLPVGADGEYTDSEQQVETADEHRPLALGHSMRGQGFFHHFGHWVHHIVHHVKHIVHHIAHKIVHFISHDVIDKVKGIADKVEDEAKKIAGDVEHVVDDVEKIAVDIEKTAEIIGKLIAGNLNVNKKLTIAKVNYGKPNLLDKNFNEWGIIKGSTHAAGHFALDAYVQFTLKISHYHLDNLLAAFIGDATAAINMNLQATAAYSTSWSRQVADIRIPAITFALGPIPIHIQPTIPIHLGFDVNIHASVQGGIALQGSGHVEYGFQYVNHKFSPIHTHKFSFKKTTSFNENLQAVVSASVTPAIAMNIDFIGGPVVALQATGTAILTENANKEEITADLKVTFTPTIVLEAVLKVDIDGHTLLGPKTLGPHHYDGTHYPVYSHSWTIKREGKAGHFRALADSSSSAPAMPPLGTVFRAKSTSTHACPYEQKISMQYVTPISADAPDVNRFLVTISSTQSDATYRVQQFIIAEYSLTADGRVLTPAKDTPPVLMTSSHPEKFPVTLPQRLEIVLKDNKITILAQEGGLQICGPDNSKMPAVVQGTTVRTTPSMELVHADVTETESESAGSNGVVLVGSSAAADNNQNKDSSSSSGATVPAWSLGVVAVITAALVGAVVFVVVRPKAPVKPSSSAAGRSLNEIAASDDASAPLAEPLVEVQQDEEQQRTAVVVSRDDI